MKDRYEIFTTQIAKITRNIRKIKAAEMAKYDLSSTHVSTLYYLYKNGGTLTMKELIDVCDEDKAAISRANKYLYKNDYIILNGSRFKKYKNPITLTEKGKAIAQKVVNKVDRIIDSVSEDVTPVNRDEFYNTLIKISENIEKYADKYED